MRRAWGGAWGAYIVHGRGGGGLGVKICVNATDSAKICIYADLSTHITILPDPRPKSADRPAIHNRDRFSESDKQHS